jgi:hypothetical protein
LRSERQVVTTLPPLTVTAIEGSGDVAGPCNTFPVSASNTEPWHGQSNFAPLGFTVQPMWVQIALKHAAVLALGRARTPGLPSGRVTDLAWPTGTASRAPSVLPLD